jgi:hypothetical protein
MALTPVQIRAVIGELSDDRVTAIMRSGATLEELEEAAALVAGETDVVSQEGHRSSPVVAELYEILAPPPEPEAERGRA